MMKLQILIPLLLLHFNSPLLAQENSNIHASISVSADVIATIEIVTVTPLQVGNVQPSTSEIRINPVNSNNAGFLIAKGTPGAEFKLTFQEEREVTQSEGLGALTFIYEVAGNAIENQSTSELLDSENRSIRFNDEGNYYIWVGGYINLENALPGNYEGDFTIEIDYI